MYVFLALTLLLTSNDYDSYDSLIDDLAGDRKTALESHAKLKMAGTAAFPALLARIHDETIIDSGLFQAEVMKKTNEGEWVLARPTIGLVAFETIRNQIESTWPKGGIRKHYALNKQNVEIWLTKHKGLSITQMRIRATVDSMDALSREIETEGITEGRIDNFSFLRDRLSKILDDAKKKQ